MSYFQRVFMIEKYDKTTYRYIVYKDYKYYLGEFIFNIADHVFEFELY